MTIKATHRTKTPNQDNNAGVSYLDLIRDKLATDRAVNRYYHKHPLDNTDAVIFGDKAKSVLVRKPTDDEKCVIDWLNFTIPLDKIYLDMPKGLKDAQKQNRAVNLISKHLVNCIGFGKDSENATGRNFYERSFNLEHGTGFIAIGGQGNTAMVTINGTGCNYALMDWEQRLFDWLRTINGANITRIDLAHDMLNPRFVTIDLFDKLHSKGGFTKGGRPPQIEYRGDWKKPNGKGRTLYIGSRSSSKFCRIYEKGKQLGDSDSDWLRIEVEYKSSDIYIPLNVLLNPTDYFIASYPCFYIIEEDQYFERRFDVREREEKITFEQAINIVKKQYGRYLYLFRLCFDDDTTVLDVLTDTPSKPKICYNPLISIK